MTSSVTRRTLLAVAPASLLAADAIAQSLVDGAGGLRLQPGVHRIDRDTVIRSDVVLDPGARILLANNARLQFLVAFAAPVAPVFSGAGTVDLNASRTIEAYPEWWGADGESGADCIAAIDACLAAHPVMRLGAHSYFVSRTIAIERHNRHLIGSGQRWIAPGSGTRIVLTGGGDVMRIGTLRKPGSINDFVQGVMVSDLTLTRSVPAGGGGHEAPAGLRMRYCLYVDVSRVHSAENINGFALGGVVRSYLRDCSAFRSPAGGTASSVFHGFACDGSVDIGLAGGNASIYLVDCAASTGGQPRLTESVGLWLDHAFADTYAANFETAAMATGIRLSGRATGMRDSLLRTGHADVRILAPVLDQCSDIGIEVSDLSPHAMIDIADAYVTSSSTGRVTLSFDRARGLTSVRGGQLLVGPGTAAVGIAATNSDGLEFAGVKLLNYRSPVRMTRCRDFSLSVAINLPDGGAGGPAVLLSDCSDGTANARAKGPPATFTAGVAVTGGTTRSLVVDASGISAAAVGGEQNRVTFAGVPANAVRIR